LLILLKYSGMKYLGGKIFLILGVLLCSGFFVTQKCQAATAGDLVVNEISWMGSAANVNAEWIELKNLSSADIDLSGWTLNAADGQPKINLSGTIPAGGYFLLERQTSNDTVPGVAADLIYTGALGNSGEVLELKDGAGILIDKVDASAGWLAGDNTTKQTQERKDDGSWQSSVNPGGTPKAANDCAGGSSAPETPAPPPEDDSGGSAPVYRYGDVLINEFVSDPLTGENEWVELYNPSGGKISLDGWTVSDGTGAETPLSGGFAEDNYYFFVAEKFKGALNNDGDEIILYSDMHNLIDKVVYGKFGDQPGNNAPAPGKGESTALKTDGRKVIFDKDGYAVTATPTKGKTNIISAPVSAGDTTATTSTESSAAVAITEIFPNPVGSDREGEFIEFYNSTDKEIDLTGWRIEIKGGRIFEFGKFFNPTRTLAAGEYFALTRPVSNLVLDNNGGTIRLYAPGKSRAAQSLEYGLAAEGLSFVDTEKINLKNAASSTKNFLRNSLLLNRWVWSQTPTPGAPNQIRIANQEPKVNFSAPDKIVTGAPMIFDASDSFDEDGDALSFAWDFGDGAQLNLETPAHVFLRPGSYTIKLVASDGENFSTAEKIIKVTGASFGNEAVLGEKIVANKTPLTVKNYLPAKKTIIRSAPLAVASKNNLVSKVAIAAATPKVEPDISGAEINKLKLGAVRNFSGTVIVLPGIYGSQYFYLLPATGTPAIKIYSYYKDFPALKLGDYVSVSGIIGGSAADKYLKTKSSADIKIISPGAAPEPELITAAGFKEENLDKLVQAEGEFEGKNGSTITLFDGQADFNLYLKNSTGVSAAGFKAGQKITATGLLAKVSGGIALLPRAQADLVLVSSGDDVAGQILGAATGSSAWTLPERKNNSQPLIYCLIAGGGIIIILAGLLVKKYLSK
jgi:hypothetical protein